MRVRQNALPLAALTRPAGTLSRRERVEFCPHAILGIDGIWAFTAPGRPALFDHSDSAFDANAGGLERFELG